MPSKRRRPTPSKKTEALEKLKSLLDSGVLNREQYESELQRLKEAYERPPPDCTRSPFDK
jgi:putative oligomerization/nucleic acid binding protein